MYFQEFGHYWWLVGSLVVLGWMGRRAWKVEKKSLGQAFFEENLNVAVNWKQEKRRWVSVFVGLCLLLLAVWRPQWGEEMQKVEKKGVDLVFAVDVSKSMQALDFSQGRELVNRLEATKFLIEEFLLEREGDRIGLVEFAGESFVAAPLTLDYSVFLSFLRNISSDDLGKQGTNLAEALEVSLGRLEVQSEEERGKAIVLFSDGDETLDTKVEEMAEKAKEKGVKVYTIGVGSTKGMPIPEGQDRLGRIHYKQYKGEQVMTKLNPKPLKEIAKITGAEFFHAEDRGDLKDLKEELAALPQKILSEESIAPKAERYYVFVFVGLVLLLWGMRKVNQL